MRIDILAATVLVLILWVYQIKSWLILLGKADMSVPRSRLQSVSLATLPNEAKILTIM